MVSSSSSFHTLPQADNGASVIQIFDSWASNLMPQDFDAYSAPYIKKVIDSFRCTNGGAGSVGRGDGARPPWANPTLTRNSFPSFYIYCHRFCY